MVAYGIGVLPLIKHLKLEFPDITQPWYIVDADALGTFANVKLYFNSIKQVGPGHGYYKEPSKCFLIMHPANPEAQKKPVWL